MTGDQELGTQFLTQYYNVNRDLQNEMTLDQYLNWFDSQGIGNSVSYLGGAVRVANLDPASLQNVLQVVLDQTPQGQMPNIQVFEQALDGQVEGFSFSNIVDALKAGVSQTGTTLTSGASAVVSTTASKYGIYIVAALGVYLLLNAFAKEGARKLLK